MQKNKTVRNNEILCFKVDIADFQKRRFIENCWTFFFMVSLKISVETRKSGVGVVVKKTLLKLMEVWSNDKILL